MILLLIALLASWIAAYFLITLHAPYLIIPVAVIIGTSFALIHENLTNRNKDESED